mgnify:CR=1 FL=1
MSVLVHKAKSRVHSLRDLGQRFVPQRSDDRGQCLIFAALCHGYNVRAYIRDRGPRTAVTSRDKQLNLTVGSRTAVRGPRASDKSV